MSSKKSQTETYYVHLNDLSKREYAFTNQVNKPYDFIDKDIAQKIQNKYPNYRGGLCPCPGNPEKLCPCEYGVIIDTVKLEFTNLAGEKMDFPIMEDGIFYKNEIFPFDDKLKIGGDHYAILINKERLSILLRYKKTEKDKDKDKI